MFSKEQCFEETPIGKYPKDWEVVVLGEVARVKGGKRLPKGEKLADYDTGFPYIRVVDFSKGTIDKSNLKYLLPETRKAIKNYTISSNEVYISIAGTIGLAGVIPPELDGANLTENAAKICELQQVEKRFLAYLFDAEVMKKQIAGLMGKGTQPKLALFRIESLKFPCPSMEEQRAIVGILGVVDSALELTDQVIAKTERLKKGLMQQLLTHGIGHTEFKYCEELGRTIPKNWVFRKLEDVAYIKGRIGWRGLKSSEYTQTGPYLIALEHIVNQRIDWAQCDHISMFRFEESPEIQLQVNDVIMSKDGVHAGEVSFMDQLPGKATINSTMMLIRATSTELMPILLFYYLQSPQFKKFVKQKTTGSTIPHIFQRDMKDLYVCLPPLSEQKAITNILKTIDSKFEVETRQRATLLRIRKEVLHLLLTGNIRIRVD